MDTNEMIKPKERQVIKNLRFPAKHCEAMEAIAKGMSNADGRVTVNDVYRVAVASFLNEFIKARQSK
jgi:hypothetical protein